MYRVQQNYNSYNWNEEELSFADDINMHSRSSLWDGGGESYNLPSVK